MNGFFRSVCGSLLLVLMVTFWVGADVVSKEAEVTPKTDTSKKADDPKKEPEKPAEIELEIRAGKEKTKALTVTPGMSALEVFKLASPIMPGVDDDPWLLYPAADGGGYLLLFSDEGTQEEMTGQLRATGKSKLYAVVYYSGNEPKDGRFLYPKRWEGAAYEDFLTIRVPVGENKVRVATVVLGMQEQEVKEIFPSAVNHTKEANRLLYNWLDESRKVLLVFSEVKDTATKGGTKHVLSEVLLQASGAGELQYMMPREKRGKGVPEEYEKILQGKQEETPKEQETPKEETKNQE
ncbi:MAG: hypothetical protein PVH19_07515 [Planctomycetia bacterium]|jgi:hypothetical protein